METFLESIARVYARDYKGKLEEVLFVFPGKRAGGFFLRELYCLNGQGTMLMPAVASFADFVETLSGRIIDSRIDLICRLYKIYGDIWAEEHKDEKDPGKDMASFDRFRSWAETMLSDFNDVEMYQVNAEALFTNVSRLKAIKSTYLTPEQLEVMRDYFGYTEFYEDSDRMWQHYRGNIGGAVNEKRQRFLSLFDLMGRLYVHLCESLERDGLTFQGRAYTQALRALGDDPAKVLPYKRVVMVGFNALSTVEYLIFEKLQKARATLDDGSIQPLGDFYWDLTGAALAHPDNIGRHFVAKNMKAFPSIFDISACRHAGLPGRLEVISSPSGIAQAKIAGGIVRKIVTEHGPQLAVDADIAVVLPDENLLLPMIYSMPKIEVEAEGENGDIKTEQKRPEGEDAPKVMENVPFNITMGYPFKVTSVASFMALLENLQRGYRYEADGTAKARTADVDALLSNPLSTILITWEHSHGLFRRLEKRARATVPYTFFMEYCQEKKDEMDKADRDAILSLFKPLHRNAKSKETLAYLHSQLEVLENHIEERDENNQRVRHDRRLKSMDSAHVLLYLAALRQLQEAFTSYGIDASARTTFRLYNNLMAGEQVRFQGEPLEGVQVMGPLETRCLDIPYLVIPSMNERIYPRRLDRKSFIPAVIRRGFGMATTQFQEAIFTYYFYRMISRARQVYLIYDSRTEGLHSGSPSRFILQLEHLYAQGQVRHTQYNFTTIPAKAEPVAVAKTGDIPGKIDLYFTRTPAGKVDKYLSASSLNALIKCPLYFYLNNLRKVSEEAKPAEGIKASDIGSIIHKALQTTYLRMGHYPIHVTRQLLDAAMDEKEIEKHVLHAINTEYYYGEETRRGKQLTDEELNQTPEADMQSLMPHMEATVLNVLRHDRIHAGTDGFDILEMEESHKVTVPLSDGSNVNLTYIIDRVDRKGDQVRIVDYKSGGYKEKAADMDKVFGKKEGGIDPDGSAYSLFQLMLYSYLWMRDNPDKFTGTVLPLIYDLTEMADPAKGEKPAQLEKINSRDFRNVDLTGKHDEFMQQFEHLLADLRDPDEPFRQAPEGANACTYCPFAKPVCNRSVNE